MSFQYTEPFESFESSLAARSSRRLPLPNGRTIAVTVSSLILLIALIGYFYLLKQELAKESLRGRALVTTLDELKKRHAETLVARIDDYVFDPREQNQKRASARAFISTEIKDATGDARLSDTLDSFVNKNWNASLKVVSSSVGENYRHIDVRVEDPATRQFIQNLTRKDFELSIDGKRVSQAIVQKIETSLEKRAIALVQDKSSSMQGAPDAHATQAMAWFINAYAGPSTKLIVWKFANDAKALTPFTSDKDLLIEACKPESPNGGTSLFYTFERVAEGLARRSELKTIILLTDGADSRSATLPPGIEERCRLANITVYIIGLKSPSLNEEILQRLATATGGKYFRAEDSTQIAAKFKEVGQKVFVPAYRIIALVPSDARGAVHLEVGNTSIDVGQ